MQGLGNEPFFCILSRRIDQPVEQPVKGFRLLRGELETGQHRLGDRTGFLFQQQAPVGDGDHERPLVVPAPLAGQVPF